MPMPWWWPFGRVPEIAPEQLAQRVDAGEVQLLDVRTRAEWKASHIEGAINVDFKGPGFKEELAKLDRDQPYLLHCRSGNRSSSAKPVFTELGFKVIYHLDGGIIAWEEAGLPTVK